MHYECPGAFCSFISVFLKSGDRTGNDCLDAVHDKYDRSPADVSNNNLAFSQACIKRSPLRQRKSVIIIQVTFKRRLIHMKCLMTGNEKCQPFNTGDCLIEVTEGAGFIVHLYRKYKLKNRGC
jgi:hypothetical protein